MLHFAVAEDNRSDTRLELAMTYLEGEDRTGVDSAPDYQSPVSSIHSGPNEE